MKITGLSVHIFEKRPNPHTETPDSIYETHMQNGIAIIHTDTGIDGIVSAKGGLLYQLAKQWKAAAEYIIGQDPLDRGKIELLLYSRFRWGSKIIGLLDYGLWDIAGKLFNLPVYKLLGAHREKVLAYASTVHHSTDERFIEVVLECKEIGFKAIKIHPYCKFKDDIRLCYKVRQAVGDDMMLMLDTLVYPAPYTREEARGMLSVLEELNFYWFEDPLAKTDAVGLAELTRLRKKVQIRSADRVEDIHEYAGLVLNRSMDIIAGPSSLGITDLMKLAHFAEINHMNMEPHDFSGGNASLHVLLAINNGMFYELGVPVGCFTTIPYPGIYLDPVCIDRQGYVHAPFKPGLGYTIDFDEVKKVAIETISV